MSVELLVSREAAADIAEAVRDYRAIAPRLSDRFVAEVERIYSDITEYPLLWRTSGRVGWGKCAAMEIGRVNGIAVHLRGQGPRTEADAAHGLPAYESRDAGRAPPFRF